MSSDDFVQVGWRLKESGNWAIRNLLEAEPIPANEWEPVFVHREGTEEFLEYRKALKLLVDSVERYKVRGDIDIVRDPMKTAKELLERRGDP